MNPVVYSSTMVVGTFLLIHYDYRENTILYYVFYHLLLL